MKNHFYRHKTKVTANLLYDLLKEGKITPTSDTKLRKIEFTNHIQVNQFTDALSEVGIGHPSMKNSEPRKPFYDSENNLWYIKFTEAEYAAIQEQLDLMYDKSEK